VTQPEVSLDRADPVDLVVFDLDGTLIDSDAALAQAFVDLGVAREDISFGHVIAAECDRLGVGLDAYLDAYDTDRAQPFPGVPALLAGVSRWAVCSNKHPVSGQRELARLGWEPEAAWFADRFGGGAKAVAPLLEALGVSPSAAVFVGDTDHDRRTALEAGCRFVLAGWNPRARAAPGDAVAATPSALLDLLG
jgi:HAD superfamily hydrolase (TIGR01549 family)